MNKEQRMIFSLIGILLVCLIAVDLAVYASDDIESLSATRIDVSGKRVSLKYNEEKFFGVTCTSGTHQEVKGLSKISIGDNLSFGKHSFKVGVISAQRFIRDVCWNGELLGKKGQTTCVVAEDKSSLPSDKDCDALWLYVESCNILK